MAYHLPGKVLVYPRYGAQACAHPLRTESAHPLRTSLCAFFRRGKAHKVFAFYRRTGRENGDVSAYRDLPGASFSLYRLAWPAPRPTVTPRWSRSSSAATVFWIPRRLAPRASCNWLCDGWA